MSRPAIDKKRIRLNDPSFCCRHAAIGRKGGASGNERLLFRIDVHYVVGSYGSGKTHLLYAQYREMVLAGKTRCHVSTTRDLVEELRRAEFDGDFVPPVLAAASKTEPYHLFWDDIDKLKPTDFKTEVLFDLVDNLYRQKHGLTVTSNYSMRDLVETERLHPAIIRRLDDMCRVIEL